MLLLKITVLMIPKGWDPVLKEVYGDYMQLPPENKRISHDFNVYMKENKE